MHFRAARIQNTLRVINSSNILLLHGNLSKIQRGNLSLEIILSISLTHQQQAVSSAKWLQSLEKLFYHSLLR